MWWEKGPPNSAESSRTQPDLLSRNQNGAKNFQRKYYLKIGNMDKFSSFPPHNCLSTAHGQVPATWAAVAATSSMEKLALCLKSAHAGTQSPPRAVFGSHSPRERGKCLPPAISAESWQRCQAQWASAGKSRSLFVTGRSWGPSGGSLFVAGRSWDPSGGKCGIRLPAGTAHRTCTEPKACRQKHGRRRGDSCHYLNPILLPPLPLADDTLPN